ncbi:MAG: methyltransferase domain-containing protein, partial [Eubacteriales bacterium]|nr:methyltransferase domain-containing protein [Eubacteriales bacterium]
HPIGGFVHEQIQIRYTRESQTSSNLSCGGNVAFLNIKLGETILDLGCGRGRETFEAAHLAGPTGRAVGLDLTQAMVDKASATATESLDVQSGRIHVEFVQGDIERLPFADDSFDAIISSCVINHAQDKQRVYREIFRILRPGGRFVISDAVTKYPLPAAVKADPTAWAECFGGAITREEYFDSIAIAGFPRLSVLASREYLKNGYDFASLTLRGEKPTPNAERC